jgi:hypothetical protein
MAEHMMFLRIEAMPGEDVATREGMIGAYVNCWVASSGTEEAEAKARDWIEEAGWRVVRVEECRPLHPSGDPPLADADRIQEALEHGGSLVFHKWRVGGEPVVG